MFVLSLMTLIFTAVEISEIQLTPDPVLIGHPAEVTCRLTNPELVDSVIIEMFGGLMSEKMSDEGEGVFRYRRNVGYDIPTGDFPGRLIIKLKDGTQKVHDFVMAIREEESPMSRSNRMGEDETLLPTFEIRNIEGEIIPDQNGGVFPSLERQSHRVCMELSGQWYAKRVPDADHDLSMSRRTDRVLEWIRRESPEAFEKILPDLVSGGWGLRSVPAPDNPFPDRYQGCVWYVREFRLSPDDSSKYRLVFLAANYIADVWLNGQWLGYHEGGYTPFTFDITDHLSAEAPNRLCVRVDNIPWLPRSGQPNPGWLNRRNTVPYATADWWNYGGILRDVYIEKLPRTHILRVDVHASADGGEPKLSGRVLIAEPEGIEGVSLRLYPSGRESNVEVFIDRCRADEPIVSTSAAVTPLADGLGIADFSVRVPNARAWSPESPELYYLSAAIPGGDEFTTQIGFRSIEVDGDKLLLNGERCFLKGASRHEDYPVLGRGVSYSNAPQMLYDFVLMKGMNSNFVRFAHYPNHPMTALLTDRIGLLAWEEIPVYWFSGHGFQIQMERGIARQMWLEMIYTDYNRPSIVFWSTCNECSSQDERREYIRQMRRIAEQIDGSRLIVQSAAGTMVDPTHEETDVVGMTLYHGVFYGDDPYENTVEILDKTHAAIPNKPIICAEFGYWSGGNWGQTEKQNKIAKETLRALMSREFVCGVTWWIGFDYFTFHTTINTMGAVTADRTIKRPVYSVLRQIYGSE